MVARQAGAGSAGLGRELQCFPALRPNPLSHPAPPRPLQQAKNYCEPLHFYLDRSPAAAPLAAQLDAAAAAAAARGVTVRGLLLTNPNNPDGGRSTRGGVWLPALRPAVAASAAAAH